MKLSASKQIAGLLGIILPFVAWVLDLIVASGGDSTAFLVTVISIAFVAVVGIIVGGVAETIVLLRGAADFIDDAADKLESIDHVDA